MHTDRCCRFSFFGVYFILLFAEWENEKITDLFPVKNGLLLHWNPSSMCGSTVNEVEIKGAHFNRKILWKSFSPYAFVPILGDIGNVTITYIANHNWDWVQQFQILYQLQNKHGKCEQLIECPVNFNFTVTASSYC